ncbi:MAG TPA: hypothetical protein VM049_03160 [Gaiellaceae bacterium]|nr:hypothetical protein [Gaiellaceae bacterium]
MRRALTLLLSAGLLAVATGCGARDALELDPVADAASKTTDAGSSRVAFEVTTTAAGEKITLAGAGIFAYDEARGSMTMDTSSLVPGAGGTIEMRMLGTMMYLRLPDSLSGQLPQGKKWLGLDLGKSFDAAGLGRLTPGQLQQDPAQMLRLLRASSTSVREAGNATVRGTDTRHYTAMLDLDKALTVTADELGLSEQQRKEMRAAAQHLKKQSGVDRIPVHVFVDDEGLLRRMSMTMTSTVEGENLSLEVLTDYFDFGVEVGVKAPPAAQVFDLTKSLEAFTQG